MRQSRRVAYALGCLLLLAQCGAAQAQRADDSALELIDPKVLRVCADPHSLPFSNDKGEGFENKIAELFAAKLGKTLAYTWYPQSVGFVRNTLAAHRCDVIVGYPQGDELVQNTNAYYRTSYALVFRPGAGLDDLVSFADPRLQDKRIGVVAGTPPATLIAMHGLMLRAKPYPLVIDTRVEAPAESMVKDVASGAIDAGTLWGPLAGFYARQSSPPLRVVPLVQERMGDRLVYRITMGVRASDQNWKRTLNRMIQENQPVLNAILRDYGVPLLDEKDQPLAEPMTK
ncbi:MAG TPA: substrate-binding domain-containing protein [Xanthobacteraceae bacterium]